MKKQNIFTQLPSWAKGVIVVGAIAVPTYLLFRFGNKISGFIKGIGVKKDANEQIKDVKDELNTLAKEGIKPTLTDAQFTAIVSALVQAFEGYGSNVTAINTQFAKIKTDADIYKLIEVYGVKTIGSGKWNPEPDLVGSLQDAINSELSATEIANINKYFQSKNMKFRF